MFDDDLFGMGDLFTGPTLGHALPRAWMQMGALYEQQGQSGMAHECRRTARILAHAIRESGAR